MCSSAEVQFAQRLASNEKKTRDKAVKKLKKYLQAKSSTKRDGGFSEDDFIKIWKGLHYCMWMQDKPIIQEKLADTLSSLLHIFPHVPTQFQFLKVFFQTEAREWNGIDRWRLDKFMMLIRRMLREAFQMLKRLKFADEHVNKFMSMLFDSLLSPPSSVVPGGLKMHIIDVYFEELEQIGTDNLSSEQAVNFLQPFLIFMQKAEKFQDLHDGMARKREEQPVTDTDISKEKINKAVKRMVTMETSFQRKKKQKRKPDLVPAPIFKGKSVKSKHQKYLLAKKDSDTSLLDSSKKRVSFNMKKNKALGYQESLNVSPVVPFNPDRKPEQGILKSPIIASHMNTPNISRTPNTVPKLKGQKLSSCVSTPVILKKKGQNLKRARAADAPCEHFQFNIYNFSDSKLKKPYSVYFLKKFGWNCHMKNPV
ncbi:hypothetical protein ACJMK2_027082 [Sinanodonta woodiana]|uniref:Uncharacterized protein n=1 Tax=Sinanodonta woodiana TaxID=1069815 RepID=A0ABD3XQ65_SINWO